MKLRNFILCIMAMATVLISCTKKEEAALYLEQSSVSFEQEGGSATVSFVSTVAWNVRGIVDIAWAKVSPISGNGARQGQGDKSVQTITIVADPNTGEPRNGEISIVAGSITKTVKISQAGMVTTPGPGTDPIPGTDPEEGTLYSIDFTKTMDGWTTSDVKGSGIWTRTDQYGMKGTGYIDNTNTEADSWLISPVISLAGYTTAYLRFDHAINKHASHASALEQSTAWVRLEGGEWVKLNPKFPTSLSWTFMDSGFVDLTSYTGKKVQLGFHYTSSAESAGTWEIKALEIVSSNASNEVTPATFKSDALTKWMELPALSVEDGMYYVRHDMTLSGGMKLRNYSFYYDVNNKIAHWVAYPLNKTFRGSGSRTDAWDYDPKVPKEYQAVLFSGFKDDKNASGVYDRGHQLPSADRYTDNKSTFYFTNMTAQLGSLNQNSWDKLEQKVRNWSDSFDTLYVVTGADIRNSDKIAYDNTGASVPVPVGYFKALLGYKKFGNFGVGGEYTAIGFYYEHKAYPNDISDVINQAMTIDELEEKMGMDFFVNLPAKSDKAADIEATRDAWWK